MPKTHTHNNSVALMTENRVRVSSTCPDCGFANSHLVGVDNTATPQIVICDSEEGGCGLWYVIHIALRADVIAYSINV